MSLVYGSLFSSLMASFVFYRTPVGGPVGSSVLRQHHHSNVCLSPAAFIMGSSNVTADALRRPIW